MIEAAEEMLEGHGIDEDRIFTDKFTTSADAAAEAEAGGGGPTEAAPPVKRFDTGSPPGER